MSRMIRILIADDHAVLRQGIRSVLEAQPGMTVVADVGTGQAAIDQAAALHVDVVVLDLSLPDLDGVEVMFRLRSTGAKAPAVIVFTMYPEDQQAWHLLSLGAAAYLNKTRPPGDLVQAVREVARTGRYVTPELRALAFENQLDGSKPHSQLTTREYQVFLALIGGKTVNQIAADLDVSPSTVSNHVAAVRTKLGANSIADVVLYAHRAGLL